MSGKISTSESYIVKGEYLLELGRRCDGVIAQSFNICKSLQALLSRIHENGFRVEEASELGLIYACAALAHRDAADSLRGVAFKLADKTDDRKANG